jgi:two-component system, chemotaxis family, chemotaxis protein CheY
VALQVLIIDDDQEIREMVEYALMDEGYAVITAQHGAAALEVLESEHPSLILLDMRMPVMDGWTFAAELRRRYADGAPIVVCTAAEDARRRAREVDAVGCLSKPFELDEMLRVVESVLPARWRHADRHP